MTEGIEVWSFDQDAEEWTWSAAGDVVSHPASEGVIHIVLEDEEIVATPSHPFCVEGREEGGSDEACGKSGHWADASWVLPGDRLVSAMLGPVEVLDVWYEDSDEPVYNFAVGQTHTYVVPETGLLVHNAGGSSVKQVFLDFPTRKKALAARGESQLAA